MKKILIGGIALVVLVIVAVYFLASNLDTLVATAIEKHGSEVTGTRVAVSGVSLSLREGKGSIRGLGIASPEGFETGEALSLDDITVAIDVGSVRQDPIVIDEIRIQAPVVRAEVSASGRSNLDELRRRIQAYTPPTEGGAGGARKNLRIQTFVFEEGRIEVDASALGMDERTLVLPALRLTDVGGADGVPAEEIADVILLTLVKRAASEIAGSEVERLIRDKLGDSLPDEAGSLLKKLVD